MFGDRIYNLMTINIYLKYVEEVKLSPYNLIFFSLNGIQRIFSLEAEIDLSLFLIH